MKFLKFKNNSYTVIVIGISLNKASNCVLFLKGDININFSFVQVLCQNVGHFNDNINPLVGSD